MKAKQKRKREEDEEYLPGNERAPKQRLAKASTESKISTYCRGPTLNFDETVTTRHIAQIIDKLHALFGDGFKFEPERITEGGIEWVDWPDKHAQHYKSFRLGFIYKWPFVSSPVDIKEWESKATPIFSMHTFTSNCKELFDAKDSYTYWQFTNDYHNKDFETHKDGIRRDIKRCIQLIRGRSGCIFAIIKQPPNIQGQVTFVERQVSRKNILDCAFYVSGQKKPVPWSHLCFRGKYIEADLEMTIHNQPDYYSQKQKLRPTTIGTCLKAFHGAPAWTSQELDLFVQAFRSVGWIVPQKSIPNQKKLKRL